MSAIQQHIRNLLVHRHTPEALELYTTILKYTHKRVVYVTKVCGNDRISAPEIEDLVSEVMLQLINGSLVQFRGETIPELIGFVRTVTDRRIWRDRTKRIKNQELLKRLKSTQEFRPSAKQIMPDDNVEFVDPDLPLTAADEQYLQALISAGSKAEYARKNQISRAAVTQRVKRIVKRIEEFSIADQLAIDSWMHRVARGAVIDTVLCYPEVKTA